MVSKLYIPRNFFSLIIALSVLEKKYLNIFLINRRYFSKNQIQLIKFFLPKKVKIVFEAYYFNLDFSKNRLLRFLNYRTQVKKINYDKLFYLIKKFNIRYIYAAGDCFENNIYYKFNEDIKFYFLEHGIGNSLDFYNYKNNLFDIIKNKLYLLLKYQINYNGYMGIFRVPCSIRILKCYSPPNFLKTIKYYSKKINLKYKKEIYFLKKSTQNKKLVFLDPPFHETVANQNKFIEESSKILYNTDLIILKNHPSTSVYKKNNIKLYNFKKKLNRLGLNCFLIKNKKLSVLPLELFFFILNFKKIITAGSTLSYFSSIYYKEIENDVFFFKKINFKYSSFVEHNKNGFNIVNRLFKNINFRYL
jgi:hypothetical protein